MTDEDTQLAMLWTEWERERMTMEMDGIRIIPARVQVEKKEPDIDKILAEINEEIRQLSSLPLTPHGEGQLAAWKHARRLITGSWER